MRTVLALAVIAAAYALAGCSPSNGPSKTGAGGVHNLTPDEMRRAEINATAYFAKEFPAGPDAQGNLVTKKGAFTACRPQDSNSNWMVTCSGMVPKGAGFFEKTMFCGYGTGQDAVVSCNDKDQR